MGARVLTADDAVWRAATTGVVNVDLADQFGAKATLGAEEG
ncbi:MAG TPA: hypothetical protein VNZ62_18445 [Capillimicrobium sp.]|nr:hypothetical protein [Capillimicrobium sp.]